MAESTAAWAEKQVFLRMQSLLLPAIQDARQPRVFEWGPGFSTLFFAKRGCRIITVEHAEMWAKAQRKAIRMSEFKTVDLRYRPPVARSAASIQGEFDPSDPWQYASKDDPELDFREYAQEIHARPGLYDLIYIDGRARPSCLVAAEQHVAEGGHIAMHDAARDHYRRARDYLSGWECEEIQDGQSQIAIWGRNGG